MLGELKGYFTSVGRNENLKRLFLLYILVICFTHAEIHLYIKVFLGILCLIGIFITRISSQSFFWTIIAAVLIFNLLFSYSYSSNHNFLTTYTALAILIGSFKSKSGLTPAINPYRSLIFITFGLAALQKMLSPYFLTGKLIATYILGGGSFYHLLSFFNPSHKELIDSHYETMLLVKQQPLVEDFTGLPISLPGENFMVVCIVISVLIITSELLLFVLAIFNKWFYNARFAWIILGFVWITFTFRQEYSFFALIFILYLFSKGEIKKVPDIILKSSVFILLVLDLAVKFW